MRILISNLNYPGGATYYWHHDIINTLENLGHIVQKYNNVIDEWYKFKPDLYIGIYAFIENIPLKKDRGNCKILIGVNFNNNNVTRDLYNKYSFMKSNYNISNKQNEWIDKIEPDVIYTWTHKNLTKDYYNIWLSKYSKCINTIQSGNSFIYKKIVIIAIILMILDMLVVNGIIKDNK